MAVLLLAMALLATITRPDPPPPPPGPGNGVMLATPLPLDPTAPARADVGGLHFLGGWRLASRDGRFGGLSAMHIEAGEVTALSDVGMVIRFIVPPAGASRLPVRFDPVEAGPGSRRRKWNRDTEGLLIAGDTAWIAYEHHNMVWRYRRGDWTRELGHARPEAMRRWGGNRGPEALIRLADGRFLVFAEGRDDGAATSEAVLFDGDPSVPGTASRTLAYPRPAGFRATDAALLPDGRFLVLNRRFRLFEGWSARLVVARLDGDRLETREVAALMPPLAVDNMEALALTQEGGRTIVWLASDDNFSPLQQTILLKFEWRG
jgi:hypothetical protein